jgi:hypothetical protein
MNDRTWFLLTASLLGTVLPPFCAFRTGLRNSVVVPASILGMACGAFYVSFWYGTMGYRYQPFYPIDLVLILPSVGPLLGGVVAASYRLHPSQSRRFFQSHGWKLTWGAAFLVAVTSWYLFVRIPIFEERWPGMRWGMTETEVRQALGRPARTRPHVIVGVGGSPTTRWTYVLPGRRFHVDFDYTGPGGSPEVFRLEREIPR